MATSAVFKNCNKVIFKRQNMNVYNYTWFKRLFTSEQMKLYRSTFYVTANQISSRPLQTLIRKHSSDSRKGNIAPKMT